MRSFINILHEIQRDQNIGPNNSYLCTLMIYDDN